MDSMEKRGIPLYSTRFFGSSQAFFFDVIQGKTGKRLVISELRRKQREPNTQRIVVFQSDITRFIGYLLRSSDCMDINENQLRAILTGKMTTHLCASAQMDS